MASLIYIINKEDFKKIVLESETFTEILKKCGLENKGGNINTVKRRIFKEKINSSHIKTGRNHNKGRVFIKQRISLEEAIRKYFIKNSNIKRGTIKKLIARYKLLDYKCQHCGLTNIWNNKNISLQLDHVNGINNDNRLENLRYLCPNCHSQTENFAGKKYKTKQTFNCCYCQKETKGYSELCLDCASLKRRKIKRPTKEVLEKEIQENTMTYLGEKYGVSDNAIRKWCKKYKIL